MNRLVVLDLDGTLYSLGDVVARLFDIQVEFLAGKTGMPASEAAEYFQRHDIYPEVTCKSKSATELFLSNGISAAEWNAFRQDRFPVDLIDLSKAVSPETVCGFRKLGKCVLLTSNSQSCASRILNRLSIPASAFDEIICSDTPSAPVPFRKKTAMGGLLARFSIPPDAMVSIGDRFKTDIEPALELGGSGLLSGRPDVLPTILRDLLDGAPCTRPGCVYYSAASPRPRGEL